MEDIQAYLFENTVKLRCVTVIVFQRRIHLVFASELVDGKICFLYTMRRYFVNHRKLFRKEYTRKAMQKRSSIDVQELSL